MSRPHAGLENPEKFGLTYKQVVDLIETGKWHNFYTNWYKKERRKKSRDEDKPWSRKNTPIVIKRDKNGVPIEIFRCINCKKTFPVINKHFSVGKYAEICLECAKCLQKLK